MNFYQNAGAYGPIGRSANTNFRPAANPWASLRAGFPAQSFQPRAVPTPRYLVAARTTSATIAGRLNVGCCGDCAADYRKV